jgi:hypothetical protein
LTQKLNPIANILAGQAIGSRADTEQTKYAQKLRELGVLEAEGITKAQEKGNKEAYLQALRGQTPVSQGMATVLQKQLLEGPDWKEGKLEQPDGSVITGWYNPKAPNPLSTFIQGGTKPAYTPMEAEKFKYDTGMQPPGYQLSQPNRPVQQGALNTPMQNIPTLNNPLRPGELTTPDALKGYANELFNGNIPAAVDNLVKKHGFTIQQTTPIQGASAPMSNRVVPSAMPVSYQAGNQPITAPGNTVLVSAMNRPGMSPKDLSDANKSIYTKREEQRQVDLAALPGAMEQAKTAIKTIDDMIGDARLNDKGQIVYETYDPVSKKFIKSTKEPHGGFEQYVGLGVPFLSNIHGTDTASFRTLYDSLKGQAFLEAFQRLKGAGQITEIEGQKATDALLKLNNAQSEKDFVKYAREFQENLQKGMDLAKNKAGVSKDYKSPVGNPALRWNPQTNSWVNQ